VSYRALAMTAFRLFFPHAAVFGGILKWLRLMPSEPSSCRASRAVCAPRCCVAGSSLQRAAMVLRRR
jgi:hypothetical protein